MNPWEKYAAPATDNASGPWDKYGGEKPAAPAKPPQSGMDFVSGNLNKGIANTLGFPVDVANMGIEGGKALANKILGTHLAPSTQAPFGGSESIQKGLTSAGMINQSAEPRNTEQKYGASVLQSIPNMALPGGGLAARAGSAIGSGIGSEAGKSVGGVPGQMIGGMLGGAAGGLAGITKGIEKPPTEAARASASSGIPLTIGQESGSKTLIGLENLLREGLTSRNVASKDAAVQTLAGAKRVEQLADQLSAPKGMAQTGAQLQESTGEQLRNAYNSTVKNIAKARGTQADIDYGEVRKLAGDKPVVQYKSTLDELDKIIAENKNVPAGDSKKVHDQAVAMRGMLSESTSGAPASNILSASGKPMIEAAPKASGPLVGTIDAAMKTRSAWGKAARRTGNVFSDIDPNANQQLAGRLYGAINRDFETASTASTPIAQALKTANKNYADSSKSITFIEKSALGKLLGEEVTDAAFSGARGSTKPAEAIAQKFLTMPPSQARAVTVILAQHAPDVLQDTKAFVLRNGLKAAKEGATDSNMAFSKFRKEMVKVEPKMKEMGFTDKEIKDIKDVTDTMGRAGDRTGRPTSNTGQVLQLGAIPGGIMAAPVTTSIALVTPYIMSKALLTQQGRDLLRQASKADAGQAAAIGALRSLYSDPAATNQGQ